MPFNRNTDIRLNNFARPLSQPALPNGVDLTRNYFSTSGPGTQAGAYTTNVNGSQTAQTNHFASQPSNAYMQGAMGEVPGLASNYRRQALSEYSLSPGGAEAIHRAQQLQKTAMAPAAVRLQREVDDRIMSNIKREHNNFLSDAGYQNSQALLSSNYTGNRTSGPDGLNVMKRPGDGRYAMTSFANTAQGYRAESADPLRGGKIRVTLDGTQVSDNYDGESYLIDEATNPSYMANAARNAKRIQERRMARGQNVFDQQIAEVRSDGARPRLQLQQAETQIADIQQAIQNAESDEERAELNAAFDKVMEQYITARGQVETNHFLEDQIREQGIPMIAERDQRRVNHFAASQNRLSRQGQISQSEADRRVADRAATIRRERNNFQSAQDVSTRLPLYERLPSGVYRESARNEAASYLKELANPTRPETTDISDRVRGLGLDAASLTASDLATLMPQAQSNWNWFSTDGEERTRWLKGKQSRDSLLEMPQDELRKYGRAMVQTIQAHMKASESGSWEHDGVDFFSASLGQLVPKIVGAAADIDVTSDAQVDRWLQALLQGNSELLSEQQPNRNHLSVGGFDLISPQ